MHARGIIMTIVILILIVIVAGLWLQTRKSRR
jgi:hypothetical protein